MRLVLVHVRTSLTFLARMPTFLVPTLGFPVMFFLLFGTSQPDRYATFVMAGFAGFAVIGVAFFQFGVGIAAERESAWERYQRTLPVGATVRFAARLVSALVVALAAGAALVLVAVVATPVSLSPPRWIALALALLAGAIPFALLGIAIGYWASPRAALPIANVLYLTLSIGGGLLSRPGNLPHLLRTVSPFLPTRELYDVLAGAVAGTFPWRQWLALAAYSAAFALLAAWGYRRDEGEKYG